MRASPRRLAAAAIVLVLVAVLAVVLLSSGSSARDTPATGIPPGQTTAEVTRRTLTESSTVDGTLGYGATLELYDRLAGTFTWLPTVGTVIGRGGALWRIDNQPVTLMYGPLPAYRSLKLGVSDGPDVAELNENLIDLGYDPDGEITDDENFSEATAAAVRRWQHAEGQLETGEVELGRIVFAPGARRVTAVKVALGQDPPGGGQGQEGARKESDNRPGSKRGPFNEHGSNEQPSTSQPDDIQPSDSKQHTSEQNRTKQHKTTQNSAEQPAEPETGASAGAGMVVLDTTSTQQLVALKLKAEQQTLVRVGEIAPVTLPGDQEVRGRIAQVGSVAETNEGHDNEKGDGSDSSAGGGSGGEPESPTIAVTLTLDHPVAHLDEAPVSVELVKSIRHEVLTVPATALTATAGGTYAIETLHGDRRVSLTVTPGMFADGYVQVEGTGVHEGLTVIESE